MTITVIMIIHDELMKYISTKIMSIDGLYVDNFEDDK